MAALIRGCLFVDTDKLTGTDEEKANEFYKLWGQTKYYLETVHQVQFK